MIGKISKQEILKTLSWLFSGLAVLILAYILFLPFVPELIYRAEIKKAKTENPGSYNPLPESASVAEKIEGAKETAVAVVNQLNPKDFEVSGNRLVISKIGVNTPIVESKNEEYGLAKGAWRVPESSMPDKGGNMVLTGHRFKYLPPSNLTFFLFHKLAKGDIISVLWQEKYYFYEIREVKIVDPTAVEILEPTKEPILTLYTCDPIYSQKNRLVVVADLMAE